MKSSMKILYALNDLGDDVLVQAEQLRFGSPIWQKILSIAACVMILIGIGRILHLQNATDIKLSGDFQNPATSEIVTEASKDPEQIQSSEYGWMWQPETTSYYALPLSDGGYIAVKADGTVILKVDRGTLSLLTDEANGEVLAICHILHPENPDKEKCITTIYDLEGKYINQIEAWGIEVFGKLVLVNDEYQTHSLYDRETGNVWVEKGSLGESGVHGKSLMITQTNGNCNTIFLDEFGETIGGFGSDYDIYYGMMWNGTTYYEIIHYEDETGKIRKYGMIDDHGNWILEADYEMIRILGNGYVAGLRNTVYSVVDVDTGEVVAAVDADRGTVVGAYQDMVLVSLDEILWNAEQVLTWDETHITDVVERVNVIDDEGDGVAELLQVVKEGTTSWLLPDGTSVRSVEGEAKAITSRTALLLEDRVALLDLQTGQEIMLPDREYADAIALWPIRGDEDYATGLFFASFIDENGNHQTDILREDGTIVLENYVPELMYRDGIERGGIGVKYGVFQVEGGYRSIDGTWVYLEE